MHCNFHFIHLGQEQDLNLLQFRDNHSHAAESPLFAMDEQRAKRPPRKFS